MPRDQRTKRGRGRSVESTPAGMGGWSGPGMFYDFPVVLRAITRRIQRKRCGDRHQNTEGYAFFGDGAHIVRWRRPVNDTGDGTDIRPCRSVAKSHSPALRRAGSALEPGPRPSVLEIRSPCSGSTVRSQTQVPARVGGMAEIVVDVSRSRCLPHAHRQQEHRHRHAPPSFAGRAALMRLTCLPSCFEVRGDSERPMARVRRRPPRAA